jgi:hypothetical protein
MFVVSEFTMHIVCDSIRIWKKAFKLGRPEEVYAILYPEGLANHPGSELNGV